MLVSDLRESFARQDHGSERVLPHCAFLHCSGPLSVVGSARNIAPSCFLQLDASMPAAAGCVVGVGVYELLLGALAGLVRRGVDGVFALRTGKVRAETSGMHALFLVVFERLFAGTDRRWAIFWRARGCSSCHDRKVTRPRAANQLERVTWMDTSIRICGTASRITKSPQQFNLCMYVCDDALLETLEMTSQSQKKKRAHAVQISRQFVKKNH